MADSFQVPSLNQLNNSVIVGQTKFDPKKFTDLNFLYTNYSKDSFTVYKGLISLWNQRSVLNTPLINMTELKNNVMYIPNTEGRFRYSIPYELGYPIIVENLEVDNPYPGLDGQRFRIKLSENCYTNTDRIIADYRDGIELYVTETEIKEESDGWVYEVQIVGGGKNVQTNPTNGYGARNLYYPAQWLQPGVQYMKLSNINGEYDTQKSSISSEGLRTGFMQLELELGGGHRSATHWITGYGDMAKIDEQRSPQLAFINQRLEGLGSTMLYMNTTPDGKPLPKTMAWQPTIEVLLRAEMECQTEKDLMWAKGGFVNGSGRRAVRVGVGLYEQLRNGNRYTYRDKISLTLIERAIANLFSKSGIPIEQRRTKVMTGTGGMIQISKELQDRFKQIVPFLTTTGNVPGGVLSGKDSMNLGFGFRFTHFISPITGYIEFEINPALDNIYGNRTQDDLIGEYPIESFTYMILDITDTKVSNAAARVDNVKYRVDDGFNSNANIILVKPQNYGELYWGYIAGTQHPLGPNYMKGMMSANSYDGYQIWMKAFSNIWVKDVTRTLIIEKARPSYLGQLPNG
jgi:hypothetical protein